MEKKSLKDFLNKEGEGAELKSHRETPDETHNVKPSAFSRSLAKLNYLIALLDDKYDVEIKENGVFLIDKKVE